MKAVVLNCSLKSGGTASNTQMLADEVIKELGNRGVETDLGDGDGWPAVHDAILDAEILIVATPTWVGRPSSIAQRALERMDAMISETDDQDRPVAYNKVAGVVVTGNEDGAHHVISEINEGHDWSISTGRAMAQNLVRVAEALATTPLEAPPQ